MRPKHKDFIPRMIENRSWITKSGKEILIEDMEDDHIYKVLHIINPQDEYIEIAHQMMNELDHRDARAKREYRESIEPTTNELKIEIRELEDRVNQLEQILMESRINK